MILRWYLRQYLIKLNKKCYWSAGELEIMVLNQFLFRIVWGLRATRAVKASRTSWSTFLRKVTSFMTLKTFTVDTHAWSMLPCLLRKMTYCFLWWSSITQIPIGSPVWKKWSTSTGRAVTRSRSETCLRETCWWSDSETNSRPSFECLLCWRRQPSTDMVKKLSLQFIIKAKALLILP